MAKSVSEKNNEQLTDQIKKDKKRTGKLKKSFPRRTILKALKYNFSHSFEACQEKFVEFTQLRQLTDQQI